MRDWFFVFLKNHFCKAVLESPLIFIFFKGKKIKKKTLNVTHNRKSKSVKTESRFEGQVTYWEGTMKIHSTPLSLLKVGSLIIN